MQKNDRYIRGYKILKLMVFLPGSSILNIHFGILNKFIFDPLNFKTMF